MAGALWQWRAHVNSQGQLVPVRVAPDGVVEVQLKARWQGAGGIAVASFIAAYSEHGLVAPAHLLSLTSCRCVHVHVALVTGGL